MAKDNHFLPVKLLLTTLVFLFLAELVLMFVLDSLPHLHGSTEAITDAVALAIVSLPILYVALYRPMVKYIEERRAAEEEKEKVISQLNKALEEVKTLSGFLPICAWCKKIRNSSGYWEQLEAYITSHSEAQFSHSICAECLEEQFPEGQKEER